MKTESKQTIAARELVIQRTRAEIRERWELVQFLESRGKSETFATK